MTINRMSILVFLPLTALIALPVAAVHVGTASHPAPLSCGGAPRRGMPNLVPISVPTLQYPTLPCKCLPTSSLPLTPEMAECHSQRV